jgi:hypothetical protein
VIIALYIIGSTFTILTLVSRLNELGYQLRQMESERDSLQNIRCPLDDYTTEDGLK